MWVSDQWRVHRRCTSDIILFYYIIICAHDVCTRPYRYYITIMCLTGVLVLYNIILSSWLYNLLLCIWCHDESYAIYWRPIGDHYGKNQNPRQNIGIIAFAICGLQNGCECDREYILKYELYVYRHCPKEQSV